MTFYLSLACPCLHKLDRSVLSSGHCSHDSLSHRILHNCTQDWRVDLSGHCCQLWRNSHHWSGRKGCCSRWSSFRSSLCIYGTTATSFRRIRACFDHFTYVDSGCPSKQSKLQITLELTQVALRTKDGGSCWTFKIKGKGLWCKFFILTQLLSTKNMVCMLIHCRIPRHFIYMYRCALKNEVDNNSCYSHSKRCNKVAGYSAI